MNQHFYLDSEKNITEKSPSKVRDLISQAEKIDSSSSPDFRCISSKASQPCISAEDVVKMNLKSYTHCM